MSSLLTSKISHKYVTFMFKNEDLNVNLGNLIQEGFTSHTPAYISLLD